MSDVSHPDTLEGMRASRDGAYTERNRLVALLAAIYPSWRMQHPESDTAWESDWRTIIGVLLPTGQATWHIHDSELHLFAHVSPGALAWDGHTTEQKYDRIAELTARYAHEAILRAIDETA